MFINFLHSPNAVAPDAYHATWDCDVSQAAAPVKRLISDICHALGEYHIGQPLATEKRPPFDACHMVRYRDTD